jgi:hypothetical protein
MIEKFIASMLLFKEPKKIENYILEEREDEELKPDEDNREKDKGEEEKICLLNYLKMN